MYDILTHISNRTNGKSPDWLIDIVLYAVDAVHNPIDNPKTYGFYVLSDRPWPFIGHPAGKIDWMGRGSPRQTRRSLGA